MPWQRLDDEFFSHPKVRRAWRCRPALGLFALALSYVGRHGTDGLVSPEFVEDQLPDSAERDEVVAALVEAGLWETAEGGWMIHDYLDYNPSVADVEARREADRERARQRKRS